MLDGHGKHGTSVSSALLAELNERIGSKGWAASERRLTKQLEDAFEGAHASLAHGPRDEATGQLHGRESGACGVALLLRRRTMMLAHVGDCRAVLGTLDEAAGKLVHVELTRDHKLQDEEAQRVLATGAWIRPMVEQPYFMPARVYASQADPLRGPGLTMSRSLGDMDADDCGVIAKPEVSFRPLDPHGRDRFVVLASDGLWEFLSSAAVVETVGGFLERGEPAIQAARFLIAMAALAWKTEEGDYRDDITAVVVYLDDVSHKIDSLRDSDVSLSERGSQGSR